MTQRFPDKLEIYRKNKYFRAQIQSYRRLRQPVYPYGATRSSQPATRS